QRGSKVFLYLRFKCLAHARAGSRRARSPFWWDDQYYLAPRGPSSYSQPSPPVAPSLLHGFWVRCAAITLAGPLAPCKVNTGSDCHGTGPAVGRGGSEGQEGFPGGFSQGGRSICLWPSGTELRACGFTWAHRSALRLPGRTVHRRGRAVGSPASRGSSLAALKTCKV
ncbi:hypothetical protein H1C71_021022, partial [Ictidomys tridecemlineatus]